MSESRDGWRCFIDWKYPYRSHGLYGALKDPKYIKDRRNLEIKNGNGWWWNDGKGWSMNWETPMVYHRRKRKERGLK